MLFCPHWNVLSLPEQWSQLGSFFKSNSMSVYNASLVFWNKKLPPLGKKVRLAGLASTMHKNTYICQLVLHHKTIDSTYLNQNFLDGGQNLFLCGVYMFSLFLCWFLPQFKNMAKITGVSKKAMDVRWTHFFKCKE